MKIERLKRNKNPIVLFFIVSLILYYINIKFDWFANYIEIMNGFLTVSGFATAIIFGSYALLPQFSGLMKQLHVPEKFRDRLLISTIGFSVLCLLTLIGLFFDRKSNSEFFRIYISVWGGSIAFSITELIIIFMSMLKMSNVK